ncbi:hypothetical protein [Caldibacillus thermoamylovorans]|uniref:hypothetical protein n=1 Tax=Caldibacillus thermoamylovorans TaxID=35841 RepID=UPI0022E67FE6|nr:hypothetical protein [Caldibacillus thermoamylovorans]
MTTRTGLVAKKRGFSAQNDDENRSRRQKKEFPASKRRRERVSSPKKGVSCPKVTTRISFVDKNECSPPQNDDEKESRRQKKEFPAQKRRRKKSFPVKIDDESAKIDSSRPKILVEKDPANTLTPQLMIINLDYLGLLKSMYLLW